MIKSKSKTLLIISTAVLLFGVSGLILWRQFVFPVGTDASAKPSEYSHHPIDYSFSSDEVKQLKIDALLGKSGAAGKMVTMYENCLSQHYSEESGHALPPKEQCEGEMRKWIKIGAENGDVDMMALRFNEYFGGEACYDSYRAEYWLKKVVSIEAKEPWLSMQTELKNKRNQCKWELN